MSGKKRKYGEARILFFSNKEQIEEMLKAGYMLTHIYSELFEDTTSITYNRLWAYVKKYINIDTQKEETVTIVNTPQRTHENERKETKTNESNDQRKVFRHTANPDSKDLI